MSIDVTDLSPRELDALIAKAKQRKSTLKKRKPIAKVRSKLAAMAETEGYSIVELFGGVRGVSAAPAKAAKSTRGSKAGRKLGKVAPKYRNPANTAETWSGRGKQPRWLAAQVAQGKKVDDFLIAAPGAGAKRGAGRRASGRKTARETGRKVAGKRARKTTNKAAKKAGRKTDKKASKKASKKTGKKRS